MYAGGGIASPEVMLRKRRLARWAAIIAHVLGVLVPGFLMITTEGPGASPVNGAANVAHARINLALIVVFAVAQAAALLIWRSRSRAVRAAAAPAAGPVAGPGSRAASVRDRTNRGAVKVCIGIVFAAAWLVQIGYVAQAVKSMGDGGYDDQTSGFTIGMIVLAVLLAFACAITAGFMMLAVRTSEATARDVSIAFAGPAPAAGVAAAGPAPAQQALGAAVGARVAALARLRRRATGYLVVSVILMVALVVLGVVAVATGQWQLRYAFMIPVFFLISLARAALSVRLRRATAKAIRALDDRQHKPPAAGYGTASGTGYGAAAGQYGMPPVQRVADGEPGRGY